MSLASKLAEVMGLVETIPKAGYNSFHKYHFATERDVADSVRKLLAERQVATIVNVESTARFEIPGKSGVRFVTETPVTVTFIDGETGEREIASAIGQGEDAGDKGANKALTAAVKYILMKTFLIPTGEDADGDAPSAETPKPEPKPDPLAHRREMATNAAKALPEEDRASLKEWMAKSQMPFPEQMNASQLADFETQVQGFASDETF